MLTMLVASIFALQCVNKVLASLLAEGLLEK